MKGNYFVKLTAPSSECHPALIKAGIISKHYLVVFTLSGLLFGQFLTVIGLRNCNQLSKTSCVQESAVADTYSVKKTWYLKTSPLASFKIFLINAPFWNRLRSGIIYLSPQINFHDLYKVSTPFWIFYFSFLIKYLKRSFGWVPTQSST